MKLQLAHLHSLPKPSQDLQVRLTIPPISKRAWPPCATPSERVALTQREFAADRVSVKLWKS